MAETYVVLDPTAAQIADIAMLASEEMKRFGLVPKVALLSHSNFGSTDYAPAVKMREALTLIREARPELEVDGEMHADAALSEEIRARILPGSTLNGQANLLILPTLDAANIDFHMLKVLGNGISIGPILMGACKPVHILTPSVTVRGIVNMTALATLDAQIAEAAGQFDETGHHHGYMPREEWAK